MKIPVIKQLVATYTIDELSRAEDALLEEKQPNIDIPGDDEGEQLTHILAAKEILKGIAETGVDLNGAIRNYSQRVRKSIS
jgi:hypothetical protein